MVYYLGLWWRGNCWDGWAEVSVTHGPQANLYLARIGGTNHSEPPDLAPDEAMDLIPIPGAEVYYEKHFLSAEEATHCFDTLLKQCSWARRRAAFGRIVPRDEAYYGDPGTRYTYSRREYSPTPWLPELLALKARVEQATPCAAYANSRLPYFGYNAVLCNLYRDGNDSVGLHADAEPEMGPVIASLSLGADRLFRLKQKNGTLAFSERLAHGSLLIMAGSTQKNFRHEIPKERRITEPRINLTFRHIRHGG